VLNAIPVVQSYTQEARESERFATSTENAFDTAISRTRMRSVLVAFIISATFGALLWGLYQGTQAVIHGHITAGHLGQTVVYVIILVSSVAVLAEVYGDLLRAAGATERLMELLSARSPIASPAAPRWTRCGSASASCRRTAWCSRPVRSRTSATAGLAPPTTRSSRQRRRLSRTSSSARCRRVTAASSASAGCGCRAGNASASPS